MIDLSIKQRTGLYTSKSYSPYREACIPLFNYSSLQSVHLFWKCIKLCFFFRLTSEISIQKSVLDPAMICVWYFLTKCRSLTAIKDTVPSNIALLGRLHISPKLPLPIREDSQETFYPSAYPLYCCSQAVHVFPFKLFSRNYTAFTASVPVNSTYVFYVTEIRYDFDFVAFRC